MSVHVTIDDAITKTLSRLDDEAAEVWSRDEIGTFLKDGCDRFCRRTRCVFDITYLENLPAVGNYSSDEEFELAKQIPNLILTGKRDFTRGTDRDLAPAGSVGPASFSTHQQIPLLAALTGFAADQNPLGQLPHDTVEIERVAHDGTTILPEYSYGLARDIDNRYESQGGDPDYFSVDKDGMFVLRRFPTGDGGAVYEEVTGCWGSEVSDSSYTGEIVGDWGSISYDPEHFPIGGPWGAPTRLHPDNNNTRVEYIRLNQDLDSYPFEIPEGYIKYIVFWACHRALKHDGPGQNLTLSKHYATRFEVGVSRMSRQVKEVQTEYTGRIGHGSRRSVIPPLTIHLPYNYGRSMKRTGRY